MKTKTKFCLKKLNIDLVLSLYIAVHIRQNRSLYEIEQFHKVGLFTNTNSY
jgi:hypothetical protein